MSSIRFCAADAPLKKRLSRRFVLGRAIGRTADIGRHGEDLLEINFCRLEERFRRQSIVATRIVVRHAAFVAEEKPGLRPS